MFRYIAFVWNASDPLARSHANELETRLLAQAWRTSGGERWHCALKQNGLAVFHAGGRPGSSRPYVLHGNSGVVLGKLFKGSSEAPPSLDAREAELTIASAGRHLIANYWGRYAAFLHDASTSTTSILRDPSVGIPCLSTPTVGVEVYFSDMEDVLQLGLGPFSVDWPYIAAHLCYFILEVESSALTEVSRVLPGQCVQWRDGRATRSLYWNPLDIADSHAIEDPARAAAQLRETTRQCVHAWASGHQTIIHTLSGGLDSSIVAACLKDAPSRPSIACMNYYSPGVDSDERSYAALVAAEAGFELLERERDVTIRLDRLLDAPRSAYPVNCRYYVENSEWEAQLTHERQATAIFCGEGGDQIFYQARANFAAGDFLCRRGPDADLFRIALDAARLDRQSVWSVLNDALRQGVLGQRWKIDSDIGRFKKLLPRELIAAVKADPRMINPIFRASRSTPSGKRWHAFQLSFPAMDFYDPLGRIQEAERITPLASQPVVELCLRIPTDVLTTGGWDRAIARRAFLNDLPRKVALRRTKGGLDLYFKTVLDRNLPFIRELLLGGQLLRQGLIDRARLEASLSGNPTREGAQLSELFDYVNAEAWLARWSGNRQQAAA